LVPPQYFFQSAPGDFDIRLPGFLGFLGFLFKDVQNMNLVVKFCDVQNPKLAADLNANFPHTLANGRKWFPVFRFFIPLNPIKLMACPLFGYIR
jgi:hypothetical protein